MVLKQTPVELMLIWVNVQTYGHCVQDIAFCQLNNCRAVYLSSFVICNDQVYLIRSQSSKYQMP